MPTTWYNIIPDLPAPPPPPLHPGTHEPIGPDDLAPLFPMALIGQEVTQDSYVDIPGEVLDVYRLWRPSPLFRAHRLEKLLGTPARIYYKYEGVSPAGSHKPNTAVPQAFYNAAEGTRSSPPRPEPASGVRRSPSPPPSTASSARCGRSGQLRPEAVPQGDDGGVGRQVHPSPSDLTQAGRTILEMDPDSPGSLGIAISEAVEMAAGDPHTKYALGSVLNHVLLHQTIIGEEALLQLAKVGETPTCWWAARAAGRTSGAVVPVPAGEAGGSDEPDDPLRRAGGMPVAHQGRVPLRLRRHARDDPLVKMHTLGHDFIPDPIHAGGLRYHGMAPLVSHLYELGLVEAEAIHQTECFDAAVSSPGPRASSPPRADPRHRRRHPRGDRARRRARRR
jgi:tryptophan synthase beta chain